MISNDYKIYLLPKVRKRCLPETFISFENMSRVRANGRAMKRCFSFAVTFSVCKGFPIPERFDGKKNFFLSKSLKKHFFGYSQHIVANTPLYQKMSLYFTWHISKSVCAQEFVTRSSRKCNSLSTV
jgi:hypothetical protein